MLEYTRGKEGSTLDQVRHGLAYLSFLRENGSAYFANNTAAHQKLDQLLKYDPHYIAHEFFHKYWSCFYFADAARDASDCGLAFAGSVPIALNIRELSIPKKFHDLLDTTTDRTVYETRKDFVLNEMFRRDLYVKTPVEPIDPDPAGASGEATFGPLILREALQRKVRFPAGEVGYTRAIYPILTDLLLDGARRFADLLAEPSLQPFNPAEVLNSLHMLCASGQFGMLRTTMRPDPGHDGAWRLSAPFNRTLLENRLFSDDRLNLPSPVVGTGVGVDLIRGLAALAFDRVDPDKAEDWAFDHLGQLDGVVSVDTAIAHLGGALCRRCWILLPTAPDWRWRFEGADSAW